MAIDPIEATTGVIAPLTAGLLGMIILPALLLQVGRLVLAKVGINAPFMCECLLVQAGASAVTNHLS